MKIYYNHCVYLIIIKTEKEGFIMTTKRKIFISLIVGLLLSLIFIVGSSAATKTCTKHTPGKAATCTTAQTCTKCGTVIKAKLGHKYTSKTTKAATCTKTGTKKYTCSRCSYSYNKTIDKLGHKYTSKTTKAATCTAKGTKKYTCSRCSYSYTSSIAAKGHTPGKAATCTTAQTCTRCKTVLKAKLGHKAGAAATCTTAQTCTRCKTVLKAKLGHKAGTAATCTTAQTCTRCKTVLKTKLGHKAGAAATCTTAQTCTRCKTVLKAKLGHKAGAAATCTTAQTCTRCKTVLKAKLGHNAGAAATCTTAQTCTRCKTVLKAKLGHNAGAAATCTTDQTCTRCKTVLTAKLGHTYTEATLIDENYHSTVCDVCGTAVSSQKHILETEHFDATCTTDAYDLIYCSLCSYSEIKYDETNKATGHSKKFAKTVPATCTEEGYDIYECTVCQAMLPTENHTAKIPHNYKKDTVLSTDASCTSFGVKVMTCSVCQDSYDEILPATGHNFDQDIYEETNDSNCVTRNYYCTNTNCTELLKTEEHCQYKIEKTDPTCTAEGLNTYVCRGRTCGIIIKTETVAPTGHDVEHTIVLPTCTEDGSYSYTSGTCATCGEEVSSDDKIVIPATGHNLNIEEATCTTASYCTNKDCAYVKEEALGHDYSIANCAINETCTGFYCNRCGNLLDSTEAKLETYNTLLNRMISPAYSQKTNVSVISKETTDITYTELDFGIYTSLVRDLFDESMQGAETNYNVFNNKPMYGNFRPLNLYASASKLEASDVKSVSVLSLSDLKASTLFSQLDSQITSTSNKESFDTSAYANKVFKDVIKVTVNVKNEDLNSIRALKENENPALSKLYAINVKEDFADYLYGPKVETDSSGFLMEIAVSSLNTSGNATYYFDASTYEPIAAVYNISVIMSQHIDMSLSSDLISINGTMAPKETTTAQNIYLFSGFFAE